MPKAVMVATKTNAPWRLAEPWGARKRVGSTSLGELWDYYGNPTNMTAQTLARGASQQQVPASQGPIQAPFYQHLQQEKSTPTYLFGRPYSTTPMQPPVPSFGQQFGASLLNFGNLFAMSWLERENRKLDAKSATAQPPTPQQQQQQGSLFGSIDVMTLLLVGGAGVAVYMFTKRKGKR